MISVLGAGSSSQSSPMSHCVRRTQRTQRWTVPGGSQGSQRLGALGRGPESKAQQRASAAEPGAPKEQLGDGDEKSEDGLHPSCRGHQLSFIRNILSNLPLFSVEPHGCCIACMKLFSLVWFTWLPCPRHLEVSPYLADKKKEATRLAVSTDLCVSLAFACLYQATNTATFGHFFLVFDQG